MDRTQIPQDRLVVGLWYVGRGRNGNVGLWNGEDFLVIAQEFDEWVIKREPYYRDEPPTGCFQPFLKIDEGQNVAPVSKSPGWDQHYSRKLRFGEPEEKTQFGTMGEKS